VKRLQARRVISAALFAVVAATIDTVGWGGWRAISNTLAVNPERAAVRLAEGSLVALPSLAVRTRRLGGVDLAAATPGALAGALARIGRFQRRWLPADASGFINLAREELLAGRSHASLGALSEALVRNPTSAPLHRLRALFLFSVGDRGSALAELAVAEAIAPGLRQPVVELVPEEERQVRIAGLRLRSEYYPRRTTETALALARELRRVGDVSGARSLLSDLRGRPDVEIEIAKWMIEEGNFGQAVDLLVPVAFQKTNPRAIRARAWSAIAVARDLDGDREGALAAAGEALELQPDSPAPYVTLATLAQGRGDLERALEHLRRAWGMNPTDTGLLTRIASVAEQAGRREDAVLALQRAVEIEPGSPLLAARLVELQLRAGRYAEAALTLSASLDRHPTDPRLLGLADRLPREVGIR
jgi:Flp pilus assembly protein TadD